MKTVYDVGETLWKLIGRTVSPSPYTHVRLHPQTYRDILVQHGADPLIIQCDKDGTRLIYGWKVVQDVSLEEGTIELSIRETLRVRAIGD